MELVKPDHSLLKKRLQPVKFPNDGLEKIIGDMIILMAQEKGLGLAANQVGLDMELFIIGDPNQPSTIFPAINPRIVEYSDETILMKEGCLTWPGLVMRIKRPTWISARFQDINGEFQTQKFMGITARCFQHEFNHLHGITFFDKVTKFHLAQARNQKKRNDRRKKHNERVKAT